jgi:hypothetical protein
VFLSRGGHFKANLMLLTEHYMLNGRNQSPFYADLVVIMDSTWRRLGFNLVQPRNQSNHSEAKDVNFFNQRQRQTDKCHGKEEEILYRESL